jgi:hypothetical protein
LFTILDIAVIAAFMLYLARKILKPIFALTLTTSEVRKCNLNVTAIETKGHDGNDNGIEK